MSIQVFDGKDKDDQEWAELCPHDCHYVQPAVDGVRKRPDLECFDPIDKTKYKPSNVSLMTRITKPYDQLSEDELAALALVDLGSEANSGKDETYSRCYKNQTGMFKILFDLFDRSVEGLIPKAIRPSDDGSISSRKILGAISNLQNHEKKRHICEDAYLLIQLFLRFSEKKEYGVIEDTISLEDTKSLETSAKTILKKQFGLVSVTMCFLFFTAVKGSRNWNLNLLIFPPLRDNKGSLLLTRAIQALSRECTSLEKFSSNVGRIKLMDNPGIEAFYEILPKWTSLVVFQIFGVYSSTLKKLSSALKTMKQIQRLQFYGVHSPLPSVSWEDNAVEEFCQSLRNLQNIQRLDVQIPWGTTRSDSIMKAMAKLRNLVKVRFHVDKPGVVKEFSDHFIRQGQHVGNMTHIAFHGPVKCAQGAGSVLGEYTYDKDLAGDEFEALFKEMAIRKLSHLRRFEVIRIGPQQVVMLKGSTAVRQQHCVVKFVEAVLARDNRLELPRLQRLDFQRCGMLGDLEAVMLSTILHRFPSLNELFLEANEISSVGAKMLALQAAARDSTWPRLTIHLEMNKRVHSSAVAECQALASNKNFTIIF